ncbi:hypothetical protein [Cupriavidus pauculus]|nr:hypothetical protein [Cupriavidus pauculus]
MTTLTQDQIDIVKEALVSKQWVTTGLVQRTLKLSHTAAEAALDVLQHEGIVTPHQDGVRRLAVDLQKGDTPARIAFIRNVFESVRYFYEMWEEDNNGDTRVIELPRPSKKIGGLQLRQLVLEECFRARGMGLLEASVTLVECCKDRGLAPAVGDDDLSELVVMCNTNQRPFAAVHDMPVRRARALDRLMRYLMLRGTDADTRSFDYFLNGVHKVPMGQGRDGSGHHEHVVPLHYIKKHCLAALSTGRTSEQINADILRFLTIVRITKAQRGRLDLSVASGGLGLQTEMPEPWCPVDGDIFARLHRAEIEFDMVD